MSQYPLLMYSKEIQTITGRPAKYAQKVITEIWQKKGKPKQRWVTIQELCEYFQLRENDVCKMLGHTKD